MTPSSTTTVRGLVAGALAMAVLAGCSSPDQESAPQEVADMIPILGVEPQPRDTLPESMVTNLGESDDLVQGSARLLRESDIDRQWVALDSAGNVCLMNEYAAEGDLTAGQNAVGSSCIAPTVFQRQGAWMASGGLDYPTKVVYLVPADVDAAAVTDAGVQQVEGGTSYVPEIFVVNPGDADDAEGVAVERESGGKFFIARMR
ncbi:hypothetical protein [Sanguibacter inulinus]|jgi:hypothetical protein|uniref:Secreted protein n=1 Tax=Sanguibacter inulinus TaxID=60922 RepID=A0A853ESH9_9MICO|nr:hypothetical protein [Sanguibacter inulinus]MBF0722262.1 hypothetical protein [Sanguibacter inulinus]NYS93407.1 hypothetical protein [Sanguibacter inulinus]